MHLTHIKSIFKVRFFPERHHIQRITRDITRDTEEKIIHLLYLKKIKNIIFCGSR